MSKLNVQQNNQNVIQAFKNALAIGNLKGIIASDGSHNFSTAGSNRNLLDNPWFTVNQRGFTSGSTVGYTVDRWKNDNGSALSLSNGVMSIPANANFIQPIDPDLYASLVGKIVTLSVLYSDGTIASGTITVPSSGSVYASGTPRLAMNGTNKRFFCYPPSAISVKAFKLELGSVSTLANDAPPDYGTEFLKCARYFLRIKYTNNRYPRIGTGVTLSTSNAAILIPTPVPMRATTITVSYSGNFAVISVGSSGNLVSAMSYVDHTAAGVSINCTLLDSVFTPFYGCMLQGQGSTNGYIDLSADL